MVPFSCAMMLSDSDYFWMSEIFSLSGSSLFIWSFSAVLFHKALWSPANQSPMLPCCLASVWRKLYCVTECACLYVHGLHVDICMPVYEVQKSISRVILQAWFTLDFETELLSDLGLTSCPRLVGCELLKCTWFCFFSAQVIRVYHYSKLLQEGPGSQNQVLQLT